MRRKAGPPEVSAELRGFVNVVRDAAGLLHHIHPPDSPPLCLPDQKIASVRRSPLLVPDPESPLFFSASTVSGSTVSQGRSTEVSS